MSRDPLAKHLERYSQSQVLRWWPDLTPAEQAALAAQLEAIDLEWVTRQHGLTSIAAGETPAERSRRAVPPVDLVRLPASAADEAVWAAARVAGERLLQAGRVGVILVAGGEATRLGYRYPKGMYPIGPVSGKTLYQLLAEQVQARAIRAGTGIPYYVMTSGATHAATIDYFRENEFLGLDPSDVHFFQQGTLPAVDKATGKLLLADKHRLSMNPDGHGGLLAALSAAGLLDDMRRRGIDFLFYHQVDNPLVAVCDPAFLGFHALRDSEVSTKVVSKLSAEEKMGVALAIDGRTEIIEYSDLPPAVARQKDDQGNLKFWAGSTAIHVFSRSFFDRLAAEGVELPVHRAIKKVPHLDDTGRLVEPATENAFKFERFIFDLLPIAKRALIVEALRDDEFCPLKNSTGDFSPAHVQHSLIGRDTRRLQAAGIEVPPALPVEISPLYALDPAELADRIDSRMTCDKPLYLSRYQPAT